MSNTQSSANTTLTLWVEEYGDEMYSWAFYKTSNKEIAEDLVQDTFTSAFKAFERFKKDSNPKTWLFTILNNKIIDYYRSKASQKHITETELNAQSNVDGMFNDLETWSSLPQMEWQDEEHLLDNQEFLKVFKACIDNLPEKWRAVTIAKFFDYKKGKAISKELGITSSNLWQIVHRSKLHLKKCLDTNWTPEQ
ncbi:sigma-70 family RNA polymerase sigma factor [bacterium]|nr:sigma-70 family RNA polymerase sigma factor [bacterium]